MGMLDVLGRRAGKFVSFVWKILPWTLQVIWDAATDIYEDLKRTFRGWHSTAREKATEWRRKVMEKRIITQDYDTLVWRIFYIVTYASLVAGWLLPPFIVVWIIRRIF